MLNFFFVIALSPSPCNDDGDDGDDDEKEVGNDVLLLVFPNSNFDGDMSFLNQSASSSTFCGFAVVSVVGALVLELELAAWLPVGW